MYSLKITDTKFKKEENPLAALNCDKALVFYLPELLILSSQLVEARNIHRQWQWQWHIIILDLESVDGDLNLPIGSYFLIAGNHGQFLNRCHFCPILCIDFGN
jgi:hypothetical protein